MALAKPDQPALDDGKHWNADKLERKKVAEYLTPLVESITQPFVISLASEYGTGKTFFIKCWRKDLEANGLACVYFNAWETDFFQDPLFAFIAAMKRELGKMMGADTKLNEAAKRAGGLVSKRLAVIAGKAGLRAVLGIDGARDALDLANINAEEIVEASARYAEDRLRAQESAEKSLLEFKTYLTATVQELVADKKDAHKKIIVFVDDLDRCRPDYAISVLECIKHLFSIPGLVFVLSIDDKQLHQAVKAVYGPAIDSDGYLRRFIDWRFQLPQPSYGAFSVYMVEHFNLRAIPIFNRKNDDRYDPNLLGRGIGILSEGLKLSLRDIQHCYTDINLTARTMANNRIPFAPILGVIAALNLRFPVETKAAVYDRSQIDRFFATLPSTLGACDFRNFYGTWELFKDVLYCWLLDAEGVSEIQTRLAEPTTPQDYKNKFTPIVENWRSENRLFGRREPSLAKIVYEDLIAAQRFTSNTS